MKEPISVVVPAYNEAGRIGRVLKTLTSAKGKGLVDEIIVIDDGSKDGTKNIALQFPVKLIVFEENKGRGAALAKGLEVAKNDLVMFLDSDLIGLTVAHVEHLLTPMLQNDKVMMTVGVVCGHNKRSRFGNMLSFPSGQRVVRKSWAQKVPGLEQSHYGADTALMRYARKQKIKTVKIYLYKVSQVFREQKVNPVVALPHRARVHFHTLKTTAKSIRWK